MPKTSLMMVAGERSGDVYGGELAAALRARLGEVEIFGCGGEAMRAAGVATPVDSSRFSILGIAEVISGLPRAYRAFNKLMKVVDERRPQLAVLIDSPSLNLRLAKKLKKRKIPVVYFVSPQIWAWKKWRIKHIKERVDKMLCIFDFEEEIYKKAGVPVEYVGHPLVDLVRRHLSREEYFKTFGLEPGLTTVALLPGSREKEVSYNLPPMLDAASRLALTRNIQFVVGVAPSLDPLWMESKVSTCYVGRAQVRTLFHATYDSIQHADLTIVASGTATLEAALRERPMIVVYRVSPISWQFGKFMVDVPFYCMVNLLAGKRLVPELIQGDLNAAKLSAQAEILLDNAEAREEMLKGFRAIRTRLGPSGAISRAADAILGVLKTQGGTPALP
jgi:lipid-A-disaccharide synthase